MSKKGECSFYFLNVSKHELRTRFLQPKEGMRLQCCVRLPTKFLVKAVLPPPPTPPKCTVRTCTYFFRDPLHEPNIVKSLGLIDSTFHVFISVEYRYNTLLYVNSTVGIRGAHGRIANRIIIIPDI